MSDYWDTLNNINTGCLNQAMALLPGKMDGLAPRAQMLKTTLQEARGTLRQQLGNGPARGLWQFELGTEASRGGVWGVYLHPATRTHLASLCIKLGIKCSPQSIWEALEHNDVLAAGVARLNYWWVSSPMPEPHALEASWHYYLNTWRPGKPREETWPEFHQAVLDYLCV